MKDVHKDEFHDPQLPTLVARYERLWQPLFVGCPFCGITTTETEQAKLQSHIANHLLKLFIMALPYHDDSSYASGGVPSSGRISTRKTLASELEFSDLYPVETPPDVSESLPLTENEEWGFIERVPYAGHEADEPFLLRQIDGYHPASGIHYLRSD